ncbi:MAG: hypothetical protein LAO09_17880 [Acidobacteriia bacterium]|nr:hypothetical protein [Terriglobia bacterium]
MLFHQQNFFRLIKLAQVSLSYGVDDLDGTIIEEKIYHMAGAQTPQEMAREELIKAIQEAGREPVQRDSLYRTVKRERGRENGELESEPSGDSTVTARGSAGASPSKLVFTGASNEGGAA